MPLRSDWSEELCPVRRSLDVLGDPWVLLIVRDVLQGRRRFEQLRESLRISEAVLSRRLRTMVDADLLEKRRHADGARAWTEYAPTSAATELLPILQNLALWAERHTPMPEGGGHMALVHTACGAETTAGERCSSCGARLLVEEMIWDKQWRGEQTALQGAAAP